MQFMHLTKSFISELKLLRFHWKSQFIDFPQCFNSDMNEEINRYFCIAAIGKPMPYSLEIFLLKFPPEAFWEKLSAGFA